MVILLLLVSGSQTSLLRILDNLSVSSTVTDLDSTTDLKYGTMTKTNT